MAQTAPLDDLDKGLEAINSRFDQLFAAAEKKLHDLQAERAGLEQRIREAEQLHTNLRNAQAALRGELPVAAPQERKARAPSGRRAPRGARAEIRKQILDLLEQFPDGLPAEGINTELKAETKAQRQAIANVLTQMVKEGISSGEAEGNRTNSLPPSGMMQRSNLPRHRPGLCLRPARQPVRLCTRRLSISEYLNAAGQSTKALSGLKNSAPLPIVAPRPQSI